ncbi:MAG: hypothetical protein LBB43_00805 [Spirochaetaceae bacterium]|jgi:hypothetical protein|nr:hypothetical protein [Spirochaetaceae bacterium]
MKIGVKLMVTVSTIKIIGIRLLAGLMLFEADREISRPVGLAKNSVYPPPPPPPTVKGLLPP